MPFTLWFCLPLLTFSQSPRNSRLSFDKGWRFHQGDITFPEVKGHGMSYMNAKAGTSWGAAAPDFDDTNWRLLDLPHDWAVESPFDSTANLSQGYRKRGIGWYRRAFKLDPSAHGNYLELQFDGIATHCTIWVNGILLHRNWCGYTSSYIDITPIAKYGNELNIVSIRVDADAQEGWWYEGAGIYRHTWLVNRSPVHLMTDGVYAQPVKKQHSWELPVEATIKNSGKEPGKFEVEVSLLDPNSHIVASARAQAFVPPLGQTMSKLSLPVANPRLWTLKDPVLYQVNTVIRQNGVSTDSLKTNCGFRTIQFTSDSGFFLNDVHVKLKGVCNHQDHAGVGVAVPDALWDFRLDKLKEMGVNAYRCSHNPPSTEFLDACDRKGILVMDENRNFNTSPEYLNQLEWMIRRDRNHPGIILWSVFNEEPMAGTESGYEMVRRMRAVVRTLDTTRSVTAAASGGLFEPINISQAVDVVGFNYQMGIYDRFHQENPAMLLTSSEDECGLMTRGEYANDQVKHLVESYDTQKAGWGATQREGWKAVAERPFIAGCFIWTGFDYRGEPQPFSWPTTSSSFGVMDLCGFPKTGFYIHQAQWITEKPILQLVPHWNWPQDSIGKNIRVMALSNADSLKLLLNGKIVGAAPVDPYEMNTFHVAYHPGRLEAFGYKGGRQVSHFFVETTGQPHSIQLIPYQKSIAGDGWDAIPITVRALDTKGRPVDTANLPITFEIKGPGRIIGLGNGDANSHEPEKGNKRNLYNGLAQVIVQSNEGGAGPLVVIARSKGLKMGQTVLDIRQTSEYPLVPVVNTVMLLDHWRMSPQSNTRPDPNQFLADYDQNSWSPSKPGSLQPYTSQHFAIYRTQFTPYEGQRANGGHLVLKDVVGKATVYIDQKQVGEKRTLEKADLSVAFPPGEGQRIVSVLIETSPGTAAGLGGLTTVTE
ncbi:beta-galactosidase [bacterium A37T11]|nr:beta-galactosidase [bacterium A37T11]